jgi:hypothetical protein
MARKQVGKPASSPLDAISKLDLESALNGATGYLTQVKASAAEAAASAGYAGTSATNAYTSALTASAARDGAEVARDAAIAAQEDAEAVQATVRESALEAAQSAGSASDSAQRAQEIADSIKGTGGTASNGLIRDNISLRTARLPEGTPPFQVPTQDRILTWDLRDTTVYVPMETLNLTLAKTPEALIQGAVYGDPITSAQVMWPDGTEGIFTVLSRHVTGAISSYEITYGNPVQFVYTQPTIERLDSGVPATIPAITVTAEAPTFSSGDVVSAGKSGDSRPTFVLSGGTPFSPTPSLVLSGGAP